MSKDLTSLLSETIFIPLSVREWTTADLPVSVRLWNVLQKLGYRTLDDLHGEFYKEIYLAKNCGRGTILELKDFIANHLSDDDSQELADFIETKKTAEMKQQAETLYVPQEVRGLPLAAFPMPKRLANVLCDLNFRLVGDLHGFSVNNLKGIRNCDSHTVSDLKTFIEKVQQGEFKIESSAPQIALTPQELNLAQFVKFIDGFLNELPPRDKDILGLRFGATGEEPLTLEEVGGKYGVTRERIRQIQSENLKRLKLRLGRAGEKLFEQVSRDCLAVVCPLTPRLLVHWTQKDLTDFSFSPSFYVRLLAEFAPEIPILAEGQIIQGKPQTELASKICLTVKSILSRRYEAVPLKEMFEQLKNSINDLREKEFLDALEVSNYLALTFDAPDKPLVKLTAKRKARQIAFQILSASERPLVPEEVIERAKELFGVDAVAFSPFTLMNIALYDKDYYLLDRRAIGLRKHFRLPPERWNEMRNDFYNLLKERKRSFSTTDVIANKFFDWTDQTTASEAAQILREDKRFTDLRRFHFALAEWQMEERGYLRDLVVEVLKEADRPLTATELLDRIQKFRSLAATSLPTILSQTEELKNFGFGFYGLKIWGNESREFLISSRQFVNRTVVRSEPPLTFGDLCRKLEIAETGNLADKLWRALRALPKLRFKPNSQSPDTTLVHTNWRFERAIQKVLAQAERPLSAYEIQWELNKTFGKTFDDKKLDAIKDCLQNDELFVRNPQGAFLLNEQIDQDDLDADSLREACFEILKEENAVLSADDLLEKLEAEDFANEKLSAEMLAVLLRGDANFEEIGMNLFRAAK
ncbi:MAG: sigma factor-like helix-turn-helix DNA-binding protein [Pyrinomonadaceae bacterium]